MHLDKNDSLRISLYGYAKETEKFLKKHIKEGDTVLDLGANIGYYTCLFAQIVGKNGHVYAFEPESYNFGILEKNIKENKFQNVTLEKKAVSNKNGIVKMFLSESTTDHRIYDSHENKEFVNVDMITLDDYFKKNVKIDFIKSNIQGADFSALMGMIDLLERSKNVKIMIEFDPGMITEFGLSPSKFIDFFIERGFKIFDIPAYEKRIVPITKKELLEKYPADKSDGTGLFCIKEK